MKINGLVSLLILLMQFEFVNAEEVIQVKKVKDDLSKITKVDASYWKGIKKNKLELLAQMMVNPKPAKTQTESVAYQVIHDGSYIAFRFEWKDSERSEAGKLAEFSDALAIEFPIKNNLNPPDIFMGGKDDPVYMFHWRAQYQRDEEKGMKTINDIYPNSLADTYPLEFADMGNIKGATEEKRLAFSHGKAALNPQSYPKKAVDEILAEGFGTSATTGASNSWGRGSWSKGKWTLVISRKLIIEKGSQLKEGEQSSFGVAVWQGGKDEVGSRKSITLNWTPFKLDDK